MPSLFKKNEIHDFSGITFVPLRIFDVKGI